MPNFDVFTINQTHLARVLTEKRSVRSINETIGDNKSILQFKKWQNYIRRELRNTKSKMSVVIQHIIE